MTHIEQAIKEAVEKGGYGRWKDRNLSESNSQFFKRAALGRSLNDLVCDPSFWQALGKARGWAERTNRYCTRCGTQDGVDGPRGCVDEYKNYWPHNYPPTSVDMQHRFVDHIQWSDAESFFKNL